MDVGAVEGAEAFEFEQGEPEHFEVGGSAFGGGVAVVGGGAVESSIGFGGEA